MHSHSALEIKLMFPKHFVLVDAKYAEEFEKIKARTYPFSYDGVKYLKVSTFAFVRLGGIFKCLDR